jgi:ribosomal RNA-processing protein 8
VVTSPSAAECKIELKTVEIFKFTVSTMTLFEVPGWSVTTALVPESSTQTSKKRKRPGNDGSDSRIQSAELNLEKLVKRLKGNAGMDDNSRRNSTKHGVKAGSSLGRIDRKRERKIKTGDVKKKSISRPRPLKGPGKASSSSSPRPTKKVKTSHDATENLSVMAAKQPEKDSASGLTVLQRGMRQSLYGARFR